MGIVMLEDYNTHTNDHHSTCQGVCAEWLHDWPVDYFHSPKLKEHLSGTRFSLNSDVKTVAENWLNGQGLDFYQAGLNKLVQRSDKCLNRFSVYVGK
ncbi:hypothetical protein AVEN_178919-1 [Araneus ventricosus]|uniref:Uncharacterized protein n=1 Tax=Araneus ventricosus TaxID=182803 RepID=A0A4Y2LPS9_ARAVE|nr:hypothetical protein AVEN_156104-1 [Araneus ventricosus]GBN16832.1 hypothetical protein AVEN_178919-1 [Araneus ventricosus]